MAGVNMRTRAAAVLLLALLLGSSLIATEAKNIAVNWVHGKRIPDIAACVGDTITFSWSKGVQHDLIETKTRTCSPAGGATLFPVALSGSKVVKLTKAGSRYFMCSVGLHCVLGQIVTVTTKACSG